MGEIHAISKSCAILVALLAFQYEVVFTEGRQIKPMNQKVEQSKYDLDNQPTPLPYNPTTTTPKHGGAVSFLGDSAVVYTDDFRPTSPGNSPGVGHKHRTDEEHVGVGLKAAEVGHSPDVKHSVTARTENDFKPTAPGHSPGVGHAVQTKMDNQIIN
ncbi:Precursor of CEP9 [Quillaja saponaria]|uniref:Precursor of CEP9 n=1 Tax=Quillaja saponaria TaxID=32244 RepID=A0AAD7L7H9_QUISA|nr:Precursor of CEP9 [Quillaja saponaria]